jgi:hypothetical protein
VHGSARPVGRAAVRSWHRPTGALLPDAGHWISIHIVASPCQADLGDLDGMANGLGGTGMIDGKEFDGAKAYKDSKVLAH